MSAPVTTIGCGFVLAALVALFFNDIGKPVPIPPPRPPSAPQPETEFTRWSKPVQTTSFMQTALQPVPQPVNVVRSAVQTATVQALPNGNGTVVPAAAGQAPSPLPDKIKRKTARARTTLAYDICRGKGRYFTNGGRSWRCRRD